MSIYWMLIIVGCGWVCYRAMTLLAKNPQAVSGVTKLVAGALKK